MNKKRIMIIVSRFNQKITQSLLDAAKETLYKAGVPESETGVVWVPGAFELPVAAARAARSDNWDAVVCLGCVIRGETPHFDYVCQESARGLMNIGLETGKPVIFGVLTTLNSHQAMERSGLTPASLPEGESVKHLVTNKGTEAAQAALDMLSIFADWGSIWSQPTEGMPEKPAIPQ
ncbi:MAG: 6,7-dimethyl-8-ribityllumazine synthase [Deltaproteobacteria bacterium]|nr:6,7-dimethyl-8-ribityllumazine synthase [Deltaproteobacteria bacterium]